MAVRCPFCGDRVDPAGPGGGPQIPCPTCHAMVDVRLAEPYVSAPEAPPRRDRPAFLKPRVPEETLGGAGSYSLKDRELRHARETIFAPRTPKPPPAPGPSAQPSGPSPKLAVHAAEEPRTPQGPAPRPPTQGAATGEVPAGRAGSGSRDVGANRASLSMEGEEDSSTTLDRLSGFLEPEPKPDADPEKGQETARTPPGMSFEDLELAFGDLEAASLDRDGSRNPAAGDPGTTLDIDAVMREESFSDSLPPWETAPEAPSSQEFPWGTDLLGRSPERPSTDAPALSVPGPTDAPREDVPWGGSDFHGSLFDVPLGGPSLQVEIPAGASPAAPPPPPPSREGAGTDARAESPKQRKGRSSSPGRSWTRLLRGGLVAGLLVLLVGVILGQTDYGYFGVQAILGPSSPVGKGRGNDREGSDGRRGDSETSAPIFDRVSAHLDTLSRLERRLQESPNDSALQTSLLEALSSLQERYPVAFQKEPRYGARLRDLAIRLGPDGVLGIRLRVIERMAAQQWDEASIILEESRKAGIDDPYLDYLSGRVAARRGRYDEAIRFFDLALSKTPGSHAALCGKAFALEESGKADAAKAIFERILSAEPDHVEARLGLARATFALGDVDGAIRLGQEVLEKGRPGVDDEAIFHAHRLLSKAFGKRGDAAASLEQLRGALALRPTDPTVAEELALRLLDAGRPSEALEAMTPARQAGKDGDTFLLAFARVAFADDKPDLAQAALLEGTEKHPRNPSFWILRGNAALEGRKFQSAQAAFEAALKIDSGSVDAWVGLARTLFSQGKVQEAIHRLKEGMEPTRGHPLVLLTLAQFLEDQGDLAEAEDSLRLLLSRDGSNAAARQRLAMILLGQKRHEDAIPLFEELHQKGLLDRAGILGFAHALLAVHRVAQAEALLRKASEENPWDLDLAAEHAHALMETGNLPAAESLLRRNLSQSPNHSLSLFHLGQVLARRNALDEAIQALEMAIRSNNRDPRPRITISRLLLAYRGEEGRAMAKQHLDQVLGMYQRREIPREQQDPEAFIMHGRILFADQKYQAALRDFEAAMALAPMRTDLLVDHARTLFEMSRYPQAKEFLRKVLSTSPNHPEANFLMARILLREGAVRQAREAFERLVQRDPRSFPEAWRMLGMIYRDEQQFGLARNAFQQYLRLVDDPRSAEAEEVQQLLGRMR